MGPRCLFGVPAGPERPVPRTVSGGEFDWVGTSVKRKVPTLVRARPHHFLRRRASPSLGAVLFLLLDPSPTGSAFRANPFPKVTDPFCRLP
ncbi:hypothetical protein MRX96_040724 [Rhipicephalus microplus]